MQVYKKIVSVMNIYLISFRVPQNDVMIHMFSAERILNFKKRLVLECGKSFLNKRVVNNEYC